MKRNRRLIWQLYPSYLALTLLSLLAVSWFATNFARQIYLDRTEFDLKVQAQLLESQFKRRIITPDHAAVDLLCKEAAGNTVTRLTVILPSGQVIGDSEESPAKMDNHRDRPEISMAYNGKVGRMIRHSGTLNQKMMYVAVPLRQDQTIIGVLRTSIPVSAIDKELAAIEIKIALGGVIIAALASVVCLLISRRISRPIEGMIKGAERFAKGDLGHRLTLPKTDELAALAGAMNQMAIQLQERIEAVIRQRNKLEAVLSSMAEGVIAVDSEEKIININQAAAEISQVKADQMVGKSVQEMIRNRDLTDLIQKTMVGGDRQEEDITIIKNGERILNTHCTPLLDHNGQRIGILIVFNEVTQLRRLENMRRDFAANVSHEIKTPLTAIKGFVETLRQDGISDRKEADRFLGIIEKHVNRLTAIIEDLMQLSRIEREDDLKLIGLAKSGVAETLTEAIQLCSEKAEKKHITVNLNCQDELAALIDASLLQQAFVNLLDNAIKYSHENSQVRIQAGIHDDEIRIEFHDQGLGIAQKHLPRLFERFYRVDKARSRKLGGTGLGLAIVKHIAHAHGGNVSVESVLGSGSCFTIHLPQPQNAATIPKPEAVSV
jgi:two-component system phosphate regulon sensor histidine kinase PhoR